MARAAPQRHQGVAAATRRLLGPLSAVVFVLAATAARAWLSRYIPGFSVFSLYYPAILAAALVGGEVAAALALVLSLGICWIVMHDSRAVHLSTPSIALNLLTFFITGAFLGVVGARLRWLLQRRAADIERLADREARYRALFEGVSEGFALMEGVWGADERLLDLVAVEANPAMLKMFNLTGPVAGQLQSRMAPKPMPEYLPACERAFRGERARLEFTDPTTQRWFEIRLYRAGENRLAQIMVDITDRKAAESHQSEMFDELNHRVKNNLAAVSAMLGMQARVSEDRVVREQLQKAVDRIQTIADVHASLYRGTSADQVDLGAYLQRLGERLSTTLVDPERVHVEVDAAPVMAPLDEAVALGLIVNELVTNAAKHAYPPPASGVISVSLKQPRSGIELKVADRGVGLPRVTEGTGIGMRLVRSLVQQCRGELEVGHEGGASFTIRLHGRDLPSADDAQSRLL
jgi:two-component sensor histidine kinase/PAS domain-containing protein